MRCKPPCLAWVNTAQHADNKNRVVSVHPDFILDSKGRHNWKVTSGEPMKGIDLETWKDQGFHYDALWCPDSYLTPINDPGLDTKDTGTDKPVERPVDAPKVEKWEWPHV